jgi:hypothetical protein
VTNVFSGTYLLIECIKQRERELDEAKKFNEHYEARIIRLEKELNGAQLGAARLESDRIETDARYKYYARRLSLCLDEQDKPKKKNRQIDHSKKIISSN